MDFASAIALLSVVVLLAVAAAIALYARGPFIDECGDVWIDAASDTVITVTVEVSASASAPTSSAANPDGVNAAVKPKVVQVRKRRKPVRLKRFARLA